MQEVDQAESPKAALSAWVERRLADKQDASQDELFEDDETGLDETPGWQKVADGRELAERLDDAEVRAVVRHVIAEQIAPDLERIRSLRGKLTLALDERSPKALKLAGIARDALRDKPILVAGYADTALRMFVRLISLFPDKSIGLALGGEEAWLYRPMDNRAQDLNETEWTSALSVEPEERRKRLLGDAGRARAVERADLLAAFAPIARHTPAQLRLRLGVVDVLVGSEAISVGHNLQDSTCLIQLDLPWNPMVIEQRIGRIDRRGGGRIEVGTGRSIVDVHYCWSSAAIEKEVTLRQRLKEKAGQAINDTRFDELLLLELHEEIQRKRAEKSADDDAAGLGGFLGDRQQALADARTKVGGIAAGSGSNLDGLRLLSTWADARPGLELPEPVVAAACRAGTSGSTARWLLSLTVTPTNDRGEPLPLAERILQVPIEALSAKAAELLPDLEAVVSGLVHAGEATMRPSQSRAAWTDELVQLDRLLVAFGQAQLAAHNAEVDARIRAAQAPQAAREPTARLKEAIVGARAALTAEMKRLGAAPASLFVEQKDRLIFLMQKALDPNRVVELLSSEDEAELLPQLASARALPHAFLLEGFADRFEALCGRAYAAHRGGAKPTDPVLLLPPAEGRWGGLRLQVEGATFLAG